MRRDFCSVRNKAQLSDESQLYPGQRHFYLSLWQVAFHAASSMTLFVNENISLSSITMLTSSQAILVTCSVWSQLWERKREVCKTHTVAQSITELQLREGNKLVKCWRNKQFWCKADGYTLLCCFDQSKPDLHTWVLCTVKQIQEKDADQAIFLCFPTQTSTARKVSEASIKMLFGPCVVARVCALKPFFHFNICKQGILLL